MFGYLLVEVAFLEKPGQIMMIQRPISAHQLDRIHLQKPFLIS
jgi:hypothetical protein